MVHRQGITELAEMGEQIRVVQDRWVHGRSGDLNRLRFFAFFA